MRHVTVQQATVQSTGHNRSARLRTVGGLPSAATCLQLTDDLLACERRAEALKTEVEIMRGLRQACACASRVCPLWSAVVRGRECRWAKTCYVWSCARAQNHTRTPIGTHPYTHTKPHTIPHPGACAWVSAGTRARTRTHARTCACARTQLRMHTCCGLTWSRPLTHEPSRAHLHTRAPAWVQTDLHESMAVERSLQQIASRHAVTARLQRRAAGLQRGAARHVAPSTHAARRGAVGFAP